MCGPKTGILLYVTICFMPLEGQFVSSIIDTYVQAVRATLTTTIDTTAITIPAVVSTTIESIDSTAESNYI